MNLRLIKPLEFSKKKSSPKKGLKKKPSILIIEDSPAARQKIKGIINKFSLFDNIYEAGNGIEGFKVLLNERNIDLILCDVVMPEIDGFKFLSMKKAKPEFNEIPVIMLTGKEEVKDRIKGLEGGASDYVIKPFDPGELVARIKVHLKIKNLEDELKRLAITDDLTKIYNRRYFFEVLEKEFDRARRYNATLSYLMIDIDRFKRFNDTYGHLAGDKLLAKLSLLFKKGLRKHDIVARYGGEEFALLLPETNLNGAAIVAQRYRRQVERKNFGTSRKPLKTTISIGVSCYPEAVMENAEDLVRQADEALYRAKQGGRNRVELAR
ncbi:MAG: diguanylate cyclase [Deltaproteobacteria bacterium]|nr:MAG: diguanylate cyclase [Deltaproteobacteria bacterium]